jgi:hypothetical protein
MPAKHIVLAGRRDLLVFFFILFFIKHMYIYIYIFRILAAHQDNQYPCSFKNSPENSILSRISQIWVYNILFPPSQIT